MASDIDQAIKSVLVTGSYILGDKVEEFEEAWANFCTAKHAVGVSNGLDALTLALKAIGVEHGDEVIVPSHTYIATARNKSLRRYTRASRTSKIDWKHQCFANSRKDFGKTKAIIPVHLYGCPVDLDPILTIAREHKLAVIETLLNVMAHHIKIKKSAPMVMQLHGVFIGKTLVPLVMQAV